jgi:hypothetical protein
VRSAPPQTWPPPAPRWTASTTGQTALGSRSCPGCLHTVTRGGEILAWHVTDNGSYGCTEAINPLTVRVKRVGRGSRKFANYGLRLLHWRRQVGGAPDRTAGRAPPQAWWPAAA